jgi:hypothetical protein
VTVISEGNEEQNRENIEGSGTQHNHEENKNEPGPVIST